MEETFADIELEQDAETVRRVLDPTLGGFRPPDYRDVPTTMQTVSLWLQAPAYPPGALAGSPEAKPQAFVMNTLDGAFQFGRWSSFAVGYVEVVSGAIINTAVDGVTNALQSLRVTAGAGDADSYYIPVEDNRNVQVSPKLEDAMSMGRIVSGVVTFVSDATSTTTTAISGSFNAGWLADTRGVPGFSPPKLAQQTITDKDFFMNHPVGDGVTLIVGSSVSKKFNPIDQRLAEKGLDNTAWEELLSAPYAQNANGAGGAYDPANYELLSAYGLWISYSTTATGTSVTTVTPQPIGLNDSPILDIKAIWPSLTSVATAPTTVNAIGSFGLLVMHVYSYEFFNKTTGALTMRFVYDADGIEWHPVVPQTGGAGGNSAVQIVRTHARPPIRSAIDLATGTTVTQRRLVYVGSFLKQAVDNTVGGSPVFSSSPIIKNVRYSVPSMYEEASLSAAVVEWRNLALGQTVNCKGKLYVQGPTTSQYAAYMRPLSGAISGVAKSTNPEIFNLLSALFNSDEVATSKFRRIWRTDEYQEAVPYFKSLTVQELHNVADRMKDPDRRVQLKSALGASFFSKLWKGVKEGARDVGRVVSHGARDVAKVAERVAPIAKEGLSIAKRLGYDAGEVGDAALSGLAKVGEVAKTVAPVAAMLAVGPYGKRLRAEGEIGMMGAGGRYLAGDDNAGCWAVPESIKSRTTSLSSRGQFGCAGQYQFHEADMDDDWSALPLEIDEDDEQYRADAAFAALFPKAYKAVGDIDIRRKIPESKDPIPRWFFSTNNFIKLVDHWRARKNLPFGSLPDVPFFVTKDEDFVFLPGGYDASTATFNLSKASPLSTPSAEIKKLVDELENVLVQVGKSAAKKTRTEAAMKMARFRSVGDVYDNVYDQLVRPYLNVSTADEKKLGWGWHNYTRPESRGQSTAPPPTEPGNKEGEPEFRGFKVPPGAFAQKSQRMDNIFEEEMNK